MNVISDSMRVLIFSIFLTDGNYVLMFFFFLVNEEAGYLNILRISALIEVEGWFRC